jgi:hypothetical protein
MAINSKSEHSDTHQSREVCLPRAFYTQPPPPPLHTKSDKPTVASLLTLGLPPRASHKTARPSRPPTTERSQELRTLTALDLSSFSLEMDRRFDNTFHWNTWGVNGLVSSLQANDSGPATTPFLPMGVEAEQSVRTLLEEDGYTNHLRIELPPLPAHPRCIPCVEEEDGRSVVSQQSIVTDSTESDDSTDGSTASPKMCTYTNSPLSTTSTTFSQAETCAEGEHGATLDDARAQRNVSFGRMSRISESPLTQTEIRNDAVAVRALLSDFEAETTMAVLSAGINAIRRRKKRHSDHSLPWVSPTELVDTLLTMNHSKELMKAVQTRNMKLCNRITIFDGTRCQFDLNAKSRVAPRCMFAHSPGLLRAHLSNADARGVFEAYIKKFLASAIAS